jgi:predicted GNAT family N-acyltransferase
MPDQYRPYPVRLAATEDDRAAAFRVREIVFQQGQGVPVEIERDAADADALHFLATDPATGAVVGTARAVDKGEGAAKIGRVATLAEWRGRGVGAALMLTVLDTLRRRGFTRAFLDAQTPVLGFYERLGFVAEGDEFHEAGISHRRMTTRL